MDQITLMLRIQAGDKEAFSTLYSRYNKTVYRIALNETGDAQQAVEIVKAVFKEMYQTIREKGPFEGDLYTWLDALTAKHIQARKIQSDAYFDARSYTKEEARDIENRVDARLATIAEEEEDEEKYSGVGTVMALSTFAVALVWVLVGLLGSLEILPQWDLGYSWFNNTLFPLF